MKTSFILILLSCPFSFLLLPLFLVVASPLFLIEKVKLIPKELKLTPGNIIPFTTTCKILEAMILSLYTDTFREATQKNKNLSG